MHIVPVLVKVAINRKIKETIDGLKKIENFLNTLMSMRDKN